ncbi:MAG: glycosyltransferase family 1 protein, partial [bacterium]|nr:glycosyltransferase family 1 protein [bacterium]
MSAIVVLVLTEQGALNATFRLARALRENGRPIVYLLSPGEEDHVRGAGFDFQIFDLYGERCSGRTPDGRASGGFGRWRARGRAFARVRRAVLEEIGEWLVARRPALVLLDPIMLPFAPAILAAGVPVMGINTTLAS